MGRRLFGASALVALAMTVMLLSMGWVSVLAIGFIYIFCYVVALGVCAVALFVGLPFIRGLQPADWWTSRPWISWAVIGWGLALLALSRLVFATSEIWTDDEGFTTESFSLQPVLAYLGLFFLAFGLVHRPASPRANPKEQHG